MPAAGEADRRLHGRLLGGDLTVFAEVAEGFLGPLEEALRRRFPRTVDEHLIASAAVDSLFKLRDRPERYDSDRLGLLAFLTMDAAGDLTNALAKERGRAKKLREAAVELRPVDRNEERADEPHAGGRPLRERLAALFGDPADAEAAALMLEGVRSTATFAAVFGLSGLPTAEQRTLVKRHKDRIMQVLKRHGAEAL